MEYYGAIFKVGEDKYIFEGDDPWEVFRGLTKVQDIPCLINMGRVYEDEAFQPQLEELNDVYYKWSEHPNEGPFTIDDFKNLTVILSIGSIICLGTAETYDAVEALRKKFKKSK